MIAAFMLYKPYQSIKIASTPGYSWQAKYALFCNILTGIFLSRQLNKSAKLRTVYVSTDHCPLILSLLLSLKSSLAPEIIFRPHGGSIGWENEFRAFTRGAFSKILPLSHFQADVFKEWAEVQRQPDNVIRPSSAEASANEENHSSSDNVNDTCLLWLNQADLFEQNIDGIHSLLEWVVSIDPILSNCIFISKNAIPEHLRAQFRQTEEFSSFIELSKTHSIPDLLRVCPSISLSSSVITNLFAYSGTIYCSGKSPVIHDRVSKRILQQKGFLFDNLCSDFWKISPAIHSNEDFKSYFIEDL